MNPDFIYRIAIFATAIIFLSSCSPRVPRTGYTSLKKIECEKKPENIILYFQGEEIDFKYEKAGMIEIVGDRYESNEKMLDYMKYRAWLNCADAVINVRQDYKSTSSSSGEEVSITVEKIFYGLAVKSEAGNSNQLSADTSFIVTVLTDEKNRDKAMEDRATGFAVITGFTMAILMITALF